MSPQVHWVDDTSQLERLLGPLGAEGLGVDTEADSFHHFNEKVCLIQLSAPGLDLLVDPLAAPDLTYLGRLLSREDVTKVLHGADYDLRMLRRDFGFEVRGLFDTMIAARLVGDRAFSLAALLQEYLGIRLDKRFQRADWSIRPLPPEMRDYAVMDTRHLGELAASLSERLDSLGRESWAEEEFHFLERRSWEDKTELAAHERVKGAARLEPRALALLRELAEVRDEVARRADRPRFRILRDELLLELAQAMAREGPDPRLLERLPEPWRRGRRHRRLVEAAARGLSVPEEQLPLPPRRAEKSRDRAFEARLRALCKRRDGVARDLGLEPSVVASKALLSEALRRAEAGEPVAESPGMRRWQAELLLPLLPAAG